MPTTITFVAQRGDNPLTLTVEQSPDEIMRKLNTTSGFPFPLEQANGSAVYVQPATIAFWYEQEAGSAYFG